MAVRTVVRTASQTSSVLPGSIVMYSANNAPNGYLLCDGSAISRTTYSTLFSIFGTTYGAGNGTTTFNLPDFRERFPIGKELGSNVSGNLGTAGGNISHSHSFSDTASTGPSSNSSSLGTGSGPLQPTASHTHGVSGTTSTVNNLPPYLTVNYIIKT